jgi:superfamily II DNA/RNA helicase
MFTVTDRLREGCHILSATTGRLKDMVEKGRVRRNSFIEMKFSKFQF